MDALPLFLGVFFGCVGVALIIGGVHHELTDRPPREAKPPRDPTALARAALDRHDALERERDRPPDRPPMPRSDPPARVLDGISRSEWYDGPGIIRNYGPITSEAIAKSLYPEWRERGGYL